MMTIGFVLFGMLALLCTALGWHLTWRERQPPPQPPLARVICSACGAISAGWDHTAPIAARGWSTPCGLWKPKPWSRKSTNPAEETPTEAGSPCGKMT